jgi:hypothetical protein
MRITRAASVGSDHSLPMAPMLLPDSGEDAIAFHHWGVGRRRWGPRAESSHRLAPPVGRRAHNLMNRGPTHAILALRSAAESSA